jgi:hypothetical protein
MASPSFPGIASVVQLDPVPGWFGTTSVAELNALLAAEPGRLLHLLNVPCCLVGTWDAELWPVDTFLQVAAVEFNGDWGVVVERIGDYPEDWPEWANHTPFIEINEFLKKTVPLEVVS